MVTIHPFAQAHEDFLRDESRVRGSADSISFPASGSEVGECLAQTGLSGVKVTVQGARTGIAGGAVPQGGHVVNLAGMKKITGLRFDPNANGFALTVEPGVLLADIVAALDTMDFDTHDWSGESVESLSRLKDAGPVFFPPDPTETSASIGGMAACNASGARSFLYGPTRAYVNGVEAVLADGSSVSLRRGAQRARGRAVALTTTAGRQIETTLPGYTWPAVKNAAGYMAQDNMDLVDLFVGMEGTLGVITGLELTLLPRPKVIWGLICFLPTEGNAVDLVRALRGETVPGISTSVGLKPAALEYFSGSGLDLLRTQKETNPAFAALPALSPHHRAALYMEFHAQSEDVVEEAAMGAAEIVAGLGGDEDATWLADSPREMEKLKFFRHALPEAVNLTIDERRRKNPELTKLGTDLSVPDNRLTEVMSMYESDLAACGLESAVFGHIGSNHVHVNVLPRTLDEYAQGKELYAQWARRVVDMGGSVSAEHGIGKLKREFLEIMYGEDGIAQMRAVRRAFDPDERLGAGNLFE